MTPPPTGAGEHAPAHALAFLVVVEPHAEQPPGAPVVDAALVAAALTGHAGLLLHRITVDALELHLTSEFAE